MKKYSLFISFLDEDIDGIIVDVDTVSKKEIAEALAERMDEMGAWDNAIEEFDKDLEMTDIKSIHPLTTFPRS